MAVNKTVGELWDLVKELDDYVRENTVTDWELTFIADMMDRRLVRRSYTSGQVEHILRLVEKYL